VAIAVSDLPAATKIYRDVLGAKVSEPVVRIFLSFPLECIVSIPFLNLSKYSYNSSLGSDRAWRNDRVCGVGEHEN
jgi:catechol 2,3-dioxygenase-like lactoylglutathione lyase family enzyme